MTTPSCFIQVVAGAVIRHEQVLIARRPTHLHQGGLWEFPGGKVESGETLERALRRELREELGIEVTASRPLIRVRHAYPDKAVELDVYKVTAFSGEPEGREGQAVRWVAKQALTDYRFPAANRPIVSAVRLPEQYLITGDFADREDFLGRLDAALERGARLVQFRAKALASVDYRDLAVAALKTCRQRGARLLLNAEPTLVQEIGADGVHLDSRRLRACTARPLPGEFLVGASTHCAEELVQAAGIGADFAVLGPVAPTATHPGQQALGWRRFAELALHSDLPVYALGGMGADDLMRAFASGGQGVAAIRALWERRE